MSYSFLQCIRNNALLEKASERGSQRRLQSNNLDFHDHDVVKKEQLKEMKAMLKKNKMKLPKELGINMQLPRSIPILKVNNIFTTT